MGQPRKRIIRGGCVGSSATYPVPWPLLYRWAGKGDWCSSLPRLNMRRTSQQNLYLSQDRRGQSNIIDIHAVHANRALLPTQALTGKCVVASLLGHSRLVALCSLVIVQEGQ